MEKIVQLIQEARQIVLSTHRQCDGDGLGAELALYFAIKKLNKNVAVINVDRTPRKYRFLSPDKHIQYYEENPALQIQADLCLIFDTNDERLVEPLFSAIKKTGAKIVFIDHHPVLLNGPQPTKESLVDVQCASTGEMAYKIIQALKVPLDQHIARALYTSITFDTQLYRYIRSSSVSHKIAAELLGYDIHPEEVHRYLFGDQTANKIAFLATALGQIEYHADGHLAILRFKTSDLTSYSLEPDELRDVIDMVMNIDTLEAAAVFREDAENEYKVSLRSKNKVEVVSIAESLGGGGHSHAAGAFVKSDYETLKSKVLSALLKKIKTS